MYIKKIFTRIYVNDIKSSISFYENLLGIKASLRFTYKEKNLELASVNSILIIAGEDKDLLPFRDTRLTILVDSVADFKDELLKNGSIVIRDIKKVPTGKNLTVKHPDGTVAEYVEHH
ncbi:VOC family protein [Pectinatus frisingensis]|uniref:VOC family protein n=1 Tax=Pectinatus frisingensis TaxID=865 RepID=UPI003D8004C9